MITESVSLFEILRKRCPLEPIQDDARYMRACAVQAQLLEYERDVIAQLYLDAISLFIHAYEDGFRV